MSWVLDRLRPHPHRGDLIAAGAVPLAVAAIVIELRMTQWSLGPRFAVVALVASLLLTMGWLAELEREGPRAYHSILLIAGLLLSVVALVLLAEVLGSARPPGAGAIAWTFAAEAAIAVAAARRTRSAACTLIAAFAAIVAVEAFVAWAFKPHGVGTFRAILLVLIVSFILGATRLRDRRRRDAVALVDAAGIAALVLAGTYVLATLLTSLLLSTSVGSGALGTSVGSGALGGSAAFGWKAFLLAVGFGLVAYAGVDREPGPGYIGVAVLLAFAYLTGVSASNRGSLVGWPLFLLLLGGVGIAVGLRPRRPLPPPPASAQSTAAPTVPLRPEEPE
jgi:hypothetical protein